MDALDACSHCGGELELRSRADESPAVLACRRCGHRVEAEVSPSASPGEPPVASRLVVEWSGATPAGVVRALRRVDRRLARLPLSYVREQLRARRRWDLGVHAGEEARRLAERCRRSGLAVRREPAAGDESDRSELPEPPGETLDLGIPVHFGWIAIAGGALVGAVLLLRLC